MCPLLHSLPLPEHPQVNIRVSFPCSGLESHLVWSPHFIGESTWTSEREGPHPKSHSKSTAKPEESGLQTPSLVLFQTEEHGGSRACPLQMWSTEPLSSFWQGSSTTMIKIDTLYWVLYLASGTRVSHNISLSIITLQGRYYCTHLQMRKLKKKKLINQPKITGSTGFQPWTCGVTTKLMSLRSWLVPGLWEPPQLSLKREVCLHHHWRLMRTQQALAWQGLAMTV